MYRIFLKVPMKEFKEHNGRWYVDVKELHIQKNSPFLYGIKGVNDGEVKEMIPFENVAGVIKIQ